MAAYHDYGSPSRVDDGLLPPLGKAPTTTAMATFRKNGEILAVGFPQKPTGYKAHRWEAKFDATTSYKASFCNQADLSYSGSKKTAKALIPYKMNAQRNRLPIVFPGETQQV